MSLSVEELKKIAYELTNGWDGEPPEIYVSAATGLHELIAIKEAEPVFYAYQQAYGGEMFWHSARDLATAEIRSDGAVYPLIRKPE